MKVLIAMPVQIYHGVLGRCALLSREYAVLRNSVIEHLPDDTVEILCNPSDARLILDHARSFYPEALCYIEKSLSDHETTASQAVVLTAVQRSYRKKSVADTWHFCSNCSQWPSADYVIAKTLSNDQAVCNECI
jgi:hypothetical protein